MNTPQGNALAAAEHALALMFALARKIALADRTMKEGKWEKKLLMGVEVYEKTLGVIGIGNIGMIVAEKAVALGMKVIAYDLFVSRDLAAGKGIELVDLDMLLSAVISSASTCPCSRKRGVSSTKTTFPR